MHLAQEDIPSALRSNFDLLAHFHVSEPFLGCLNAPVIDHPRVARTLRDLGYTGWVSLEMRAADEPLAALQPAVEYLARTYHRDN